MEIQSNKLIKLDRYEIQNELGRGAMGVVYLGFDPVIDRVVAIKTIKSDTAPSQNISYEMLYREAQMAGKLNHPDITLIYDVGEDEGIHFIVMEYVTGQTLKELIDKKTLLSLSDKIRLIISIASALHYAHQRGIIHRDIKPANIMLLENNLIKIMDFGIAKNLSSGAESSSISNKIVGTPAYMSPEQILNQEITRQTDVYSLGVLSYELLSGIKPFSADSMPKLIEKVLHLQPAPLHEVDTSLSAKLGAIVMKALEKSRQSRYKTASELADALEMYLAESELTATDGQGVAYDVENLAHMLKKNYTFFSDFTLEDLEKLIGISRKKKYKKDEQIFREGSVGRRMYIIIHGEVRIIKNYQEEEASLLTVLYSGSCFGEMAFLESSPRSASAIAGAESTLVEINEVVLRSSDPRMCLKLYKNLTSVIVERLKESNEKNNKLSHEIKKIRDASLRCASIQSVRDSGLFDHIFPLFTGNTGIDIKIIGAEADFALEMGKAGTVDLIFTNAKDSEIALVQAGWLVNRHEIMYDELALLGPRDDPAGINKAKSLSEALYNISTRGSVFISRGDDSGIHHLERSMWAGNGIEVSSESWYLEVGQGMRETLKFASERKGYTLCDMASYLMVKAEEDFLLAILRKDPSLMNHYAVMAVNPLKHPQVKYKEVTDFINWLTSKEGQRSIGAFRSKTGDVLYHPDAG